MKLGVYEEINSFVGENLHLHRQLLLILTRMSQKMHMGTQHATYVETALSWCFQHEQQNCVRETMFSGVRL